MLRNRLLFGITFSFLVLVASSHLLAQGTQADYDRMEQLGRLTRGKVYRTEVSPNWLPSNQHFWYRVRAGESRHEFVFVDLPAQSREPAFDHAKVAEQLGALTERKLAPEDLPFTELRFSDDYATIYVRFADKAWAIDRKGSAISPADESLAPGSATTGLTRIRPSVDKGEEMELEFINESEGTIQTIWIDRTGRPVPYQTVAKGESIKQHTFVGHVWLVQNEDREPLALLEASADSPKVRVDGKTKIEIQRGRGRGRGGRAAFGGRGGRGPGGFGNGSSPDARFRASIEDDELTIKDNETDEIVLSAAVDEDGQELARGRFYWSPDSRWLVTLQVKPVEQRTIYMVESSPEDQLQPKLHEMSYAKPGDEIRTEKPRLFDLQNQTEVPLDDELYLSPWSLNRYGWRNDSSEFCFLYNQRGHQAMRFVAINPEQGTARAVIDEVTETFIDYTNKVFIEDLEESGEMIWMSERDGWNHLYLYDYGSGEVKNQITSGEWVVRSVDRVDREKRQIWFQASGIVPGQDPYFIHHCRIDFDGSNLVVMTGGDGTHSITYSPDNTYIIDEYSRVDLPNVTTVRRVDDGSLVCELEQGDCSELVEAGWNPTIPFSAKGRDGETDIYGVIYLPTNFDPSAKYPVIEYIYAGPQGSFVPKSFQTGGQTRSMAELGFIVVQIDGMGTNNRSKAFHDVCWQNLGDSGFPDRILWMQAAAKEYPQMDLSRVGIYGGSAGGQSATRALLAHGDFYKVGVSDCGCHDNRVDKIWWNEQWMGWPIDSHYDEQSNVTQAHRLTGKLFLIVGELDRNVDPASTMQVVNAFVKADKDFDLLVVPGGGHGSGSSRYGMRRTRDFFVRHLLGTEPRSE